MNSRTGTPETPATHESDVHLSVRTSFSELHSGQPAASVVSPAIEVHSPACPRPIE